MPIEELLAKLPARNEVPDVLLAEPVVPKRLSWEPSESEPEGDEDWRVASR